MPAFVSFFKTLGASRIIAMGVVTLALMAFFAFLILRAAQPQMSPLFTDLSLEDSSAIIKDLKITEPADQAAKVQTEVGQAVPAGIPLQPMPVEVAAKVPQLKAHSFLVKNDKVIIIDPKDNKVAALIE